MAAKNTNAKNTTNASNTNALSVLDIGTTLEFDKNDVLAIVVSRAEDLIQSNITSSTKLMKSLEKELEDKKRSLNDALLNYAEFRFKSAVDAFKSAYELLNCPFKSEISAKENNNKIEVTISINANDYSTRITHNIKVDFTDDHVKMSDAIKKHEEKLTNAREDVCSWRKRLANIPSLERRYRGKLAEAQLSTTSAGREIMASLNLDGFDKEILALPGV